MRGLACATALRIECCPSEMTPAMGTCNPVQMVATSSNKGTRSCSVAPNKLRASSDFLRHPVRLKFLLQAPGLPAILGNEVAPMKGVARDLRKDPAQRLPFEIRSLDPDLVSEWSSGQGSYHVDDRPMPGDSPGIYARSIETKRGAPFVYGQAATQVFSSWEDPYILDSTAIEHPGEMDLTFPCLADSAIGLITYPIDMPIPNKLSKELEFVG